MDGHSWGERLLAALRKEPVEMPGAENAPDRGFCASGGMPWVSPGLEVEGIGQVEFPLTSATLKRLLKHARQAPYGKGIQTVVDTDVRRVHELDPERFQLTGPKWNGLLEFVVTEVEDRLGLAGFELKPHLYKLLVYQEGDFFLPHRDGEKLDGMVATLVITLPSPHEGGELVVTHGGATKTIRAEVAAQGEDLSYAAFYADCQHEVKPLTQGHRVCLVYNLTLGAAKSMPKPPQPTGSIENAPGKGAFSKVLADWAGQSEPTAKLAFALEHRYSAEGLTFDLLKGPDRRTAKLLLAAAEQASCVAHLALIVYWQQGDAEGAWEAEYYGRRRGRYGYGGYGDEDEDLAPGARQMGEIHDYGFSLSHWSDPEGNQVPLGTIPLEQGEIVSDRDPEQWELAREDFEGYTGNAGMTLERWYHQAAIVVWPREQHLKVICDAGTDAAIGGLKQLIQRMNQSDKGQRGALREEARSLAEAMIETWRPRSYWSNHSWDDSTDRVDRNEIFALLDQLDDLNLMVEIVWRIVPIDKSLILGEHFVKFARRHGWEHFEEPLVVELQRFDLEFDPIERNITMLHSLCTAKDLTAKDKAVCGRLCAAAVTGLSAYDEQISPEDWQWERVSHVEQLNQLTEAMLTVDAREALARLISHVTSNDHKYLLADHQLEVLFAMERTLEKLHPSHPLVSQWLTHCLTELRRRKANEPKRPNDFRREAKLTCNCADCKLVNAFLANPKEEVLRIKAVQNRRTHVQDKIEWAECDLKCTTLRNGSPHTLICTKTIASYELGAKHYLRDLKYLERVEKLMASIERRG